MFAKIFGYFVTGFVLLSHLSPAVAATEKMGEAETRIVGGEFVGIAEVPYVVQLLMNGRFFCGGSLVSVMYVVTAAHCVEGVNEEQLTIVGGASKLTQEGVRRKVAKIKAHKDFNMRTLTHDVAVLKLDEAMEGTNIGTIELNTEAFLPPMVRVSGWGLKKENGMEPSGHVQTIWVTVKPKGKCKAQYKNFITLTPTMFCASAPGYKDSCSGDSGGPAANGGILYGIVSWAYGCAREKYPGVYTSVKSVLGFIKESMSE